MTKSADHDAGIPDRLLRELRLKIPDPNSPEIRRRVAESVARLSQEVEAEALAWIESVSEFDERPDERPSVGPGVVRK